jgi:hypothetical protein
MNDADINFTLERFREVFAIRSATWPVRGWTASAWQLRPHYALGVLAGNGPRFKLVIGEPGSLVGTFMTAERTARRRDDHAEHIRRHHSC